uniref:Protein DETOXIFICATION n=1 Tax=Oryza brachyantha TaxID=4533 RepID=J3LQD4_ORYBR
MLGMGSAVETLCGQAYGAHKYDMLGIYMQRSVILLTAVGVPLAAGYALSRPILLHLGQSPAIADAAQLFMYGLIPQIFAYVIYVFSKELLIFLGESPEIAGAARLYVVGLIPQIFAYAANFPIQKFLQAQSIVAPSAYISAAALALHLVLGWLAVYRLRMGLLGASLVLSLSWWAAVAAQFAYIVAGERCRRTWTGLSWRAFSGLPGFLRLSASSAVMLCLETWYYQVVVLVAGLLPDPQLALDALTVCLTLFGWMFMVSIGFNAAASVRVGNELGAGHPRAAAFSVVVVTAMSLAITAAMAAMFLVFRGYVSYIFTRGEAVARAVSDLAPLLAATIVLNGIQPVLSGVAVGCGWQRFVAFVNVGCYYIVGIPVGVLLGFRFHLGAKGIWGGMLGGTCMQALLLSWTIFRADWNKEVDETKKRLNKWEDKKQEAAPL